MGCLQLCFFAVSSGFTVDGGQLTICSSGSEGFFYVEIRVQDGKALTLESGYIWGSIQGVDNSFTVNVNGGRADKIIIPSFANGTVNMPGGTVGTLKSDGSLTLTQTGGTINNVQGDNAPTFYTITYNANGGSGTMEPQKVAAGST
ncbi:MAG: hypothetical protein J6X60_10475, partial [Ruminiclostridium sp.]|nr:hypothetical protein [Ruminiclostridium sp.]